MSVECKDCKYLIINGFAANTVCHHPKNLWNGKKRAVVSHRMLNCDGACDWYKPSIKKRLKDQWVRIKAKLNYIISTARRRFRP